MLLLALVIACLVRTFVVEGFRIPTESMEQSLLVGDFVLVSKLHYGPRIPRTLGIPFTDWYLEDVNLPAMRLPGFDRIERGDAIVFNYPRSAEPVDRRAHYIKRVVGLPGDTVALRGPMPFVNGQPLPAPPGVRMRWTVHLTDAVDHVVERLEAERTVRVVEVDRRRRRVVFEASQMLARQVATWQGVVDLAPWALWRDSDHPAHSVALQSEGEGDGYGPVYVPARGDTLRLTPHNWATYEDLITQHEGHVARLLPGGYVEIDGEPARYYVVEQDYFFVLGDNRNNSVDSRVWGFVPMDHVVGKALLIYFSWDEEQRRVRWGRLLAPVR